MTIKLPMTTGFEPTSSVVPNNEWPHYPIQLALFVSLLTAQPLLFTMTIDIKKWWWPNNWSHKRFAEGPVNQGLHSEATITTSAQLLVSSNFFHTIINHQMCLLQPQQRKILWPDLLNWPLSLIGKVPSKSWM